MENDEIKRIYSKILKGISIWASETYKRSLIIIAFILIFGFPLIQYLQHQVSTFNYTNFAMTSFVFLQHTFNPAYYLIGMGFLIIAIFLYWILKMINRNRAVDDHFKKGLVGWAVPLGSSWTTQHCIDKPGKMLYVTNSTYPGILKEAYWWYDYEVSFEAKIFAFNTSLLDTFENEEDSEEKIIAAAIKKIKDYIDKETVHDLEEYIFKYKSHEFIPEDNPKWWTKTLRTLFKT